MFELLYTSVSPKGLSEPDLMTLLQAARCKNQGLDITGMLVYHDREFMQLLEGEESIVKNLYQRILTDNRHTSVELLYQGTIENRAFGEWSMAFKLLDEKAVNALIPGYEEFDRKISPINMIKASPNRGKRTFLSLRDSL
ncbi:BLUF domain-containing protein [Thalassomonas haliotis]|uniref:BLUF domain-containing protein n=1 Tax=Thalassomonas haliotis TaxID=485448 RepID=A0ABY7VK00_9GAMM|nr:BLUF domain-containing protein [Thalassomonas haliotis]WDE12987.1 BLUF domain-containing protein [Thalassomonas haliotis]